MLRKDRRVRPYGKNESTAEDPCHHHEDAPAKHYE